MTSALVALGSNIRPRRATILSGVARLSGLPDTRVVAISPLRETDPDGGSPDMDTFLNGACLLETGLAARALLGSLLRIELEHGRKRDRPAGPRTLDLDLILFGSAVVDEPDLVVPHPRAHARMFVLEPAADVAPYLLHPLLRRTLAELRDELRGPP